MKFYELLSLLFGIEKQINIKDEYGQYSSRITSDKQFSYEEIGDIPELFDIEFHDFVFSDGSEDYFEKLDHNLALATLLQQNGYYSKSLYILQMMHENGLGIQNQLVDISVRNLVGMDNFQSAINILQIAIKKFSDKNPEMWGRTVQRWKKEVSALSEKQINFDQSVITSTEFSDYIDLEKIPEVDVVIIKGASYITRDKLQMNPNIFNKYNKHYNMAKNIPGRSKSSMKKSNFFIQRIVDKYNFYTDEMLDLLTRNYKTLKDWDNARSILNLGLELSKDKQLKLVFKNRLKTWSFK